MPRSAISPDTTTVALAIADLDGINGPDIITADDGYGNIEVLLNNGDGTFGSATAYSAPGSSHLNLAVADVNGDGKPDVVTADLYGGTVSVLLNNGDGTLGAASSYYDGGYYTSDVAVGDVNGDGRSDIVAANQEYGTVSVLLQNIDGSFAWPTTYGIGSYYSNSVALGDVNNDGTLDIVVVAQYNYSYSAGVVSVLFNNGDGTFAPAVNMDSGYYTVDVALGDLNSDGRLDVATANTWAYSLSVFLGQPPLEIKLIAPDQTNVLATSSPTADFDAAITDFVAPEDGTYYIVVPSLMASVQYTVVVTRDADLPTPSSTIAASVQSSTTAMLASAAGQLILTTPATSTQPSGPAPSSEELAVLDALFVEAGRVADRSHLPGTSQPSPRDLGAKNRFARADFAKAGPNWRAFRAALQELNLLDAYEAGDKSVLDKLFAEYGSTLHKGKEGVSLWDFVR